MTRVLLAGSVASDTMLAHKLKLQGYSTCASSERSQSISDELGDVCVVIYGARDSDLSFLRHCSSTPTIVVSRNPEPRAVVSAIRAGASDYLVRPFSTDELFASVERATSEATGERTNAAGEDTLGEMLGDSAVMQKLAERIRRVGPTQSPVLIHGEIGSGKELVARAVHASSRRSHLPLIIMHCASIPETLQESELFGDANAARGELDHSTGLIEAAHNSSLFLDDIGELTASSQAKLLRVLQNGENRRIGSNTTQAADVRLICACQRDLAALVESGRFREDLYYRLNVVSLVPPPLRDRDDDKIRLAEHFLQRSARKLSRPSAQLTADALEAINAYRWPGNVREMENAIERAVILSNDGVITPELLAIDISASPPTETPADADPNISLEDYFVKFVTENQDQCTETELAERLGISRKSLWERRQRLNIPRKRTRKRAPRRS